ncbi:MAG TPA: DUF6624 domain-containing protein [Holophagaceae bacterium]|nr:DUF6624 domain-containing protein [Holophagaceae bacterium]
MRTRALLLGVCAAWSSAQDAPGPWQADLAAFDAAFAKLQAEGPRRAVDVETRAGVIRVLEQLEKEDQFLRSRWQLPWEHGYGGTAAEVAFKKAFEPRSLAMDKANAEALRRILDRWGWLDPRTWGKPTEDRAWLLAQHADHDVAFQKRVLGMMEALVPKGGADPLHFAYLWDRVAVNEGRPQRYGTQGRCVGPGRWEPRAMEDPEHVDARRDAVGLPPMVDYLATFKGMCH